MDDVQLPDLNVELVPPSGSSVVGPLPGDPEAEGEEEEDGDDVRSEG